MQIKCQVNVSNRASPKGSFKTVYGVIKLAKKSGETQDDVYITLNTTQSTVPSVYKVKTNIERTFTKFITEGKATIQFLNPPHDLYFQKADPLQLKLFFQAIRMVLAGNYSKALRLSSLQTFSNRVTPPQRQLTIKSRKNYPSFGSSFPKSLEKLFINRCELLLIDSRILKLKSLTLLNLSQNKIKKLPDVALPATLPNLRELNLSHNELCEIPEQFLTLGFEKSIQGLDLRYNHLASLPVTISSLSSLLYLRLDHNQLISLPDNFGNLSKLEVLTASHNMLDFVPVSLKSLHLREVDFYSNEFEFGSCIMHLPDFNCSVTSLLELSARSIVKNRLPYNDESLPKLLQSFLKTAKLCICSSPCFESTYMGKCLLDLQKIAENVTAVDEQGSTVVPCILTVCSYKCYKFVYSAVSKGKSL